MAQPGNATRLSRTRGSVSQRGSCLSTHRLRTMPSATGPDLKKYMDKRLSIKLNGSRTVLGVLRGFDQFMNLVLDETVEQVSASEQNNIGMVVIRGNSVVMIEALEKLHGEGP